MASGARLGWMHATMDGRSRRRRATTADPTRDRDRSDAERTLQLFLDNSCVFDVTHYNGARRRLHP